MTGETGVFTDVMVATANKKSAAKLALPDEVFDGITRELCAENQAPSKDSFLTIRSGVIHLLKLGDGTEN